MVGNMEYIVYASSNSAEQLINEINQCKGWPSEDGFTLTWMANPNTICEFNLETGEQTQIGYGVVIKDEIIECLTEAQKLEIITLEGNINLCSWIPPITSGSTENYFTQFFSGQTNN